jgi:hypothetical protein
MERKKSDQEGKKEQRNEGGRKIYAYGEMRHLKNCDLLKKFRLSSPIICKEVPSFSKPRRTTPLQIPHVTRYYPYMLIHGKIKLFLYRMHSLTLHKAQKQRLIGLVPKAALYERKPNILDIT